MFLVGRIESRLWDFGAQEHLNALSRRSREESGAEKTVNCHGLAPEVSEEKNISKWTRDSSWDILLKM